MHSEQPKNSSKNIFDKEEITAEDLDKLSFEDKLVPLKIDGQVIGTAKVFSNSEGIYAEVQLDDQEFNELVSAEDGRTSIDYMNNTDAVNHNHVVIQHRDGKEAWCNICKLNAIGQPPRSAFPHVS